MAIVILLCCALVAAGWRETAGVACNRLCTESRPREGRQDPTRAAGEALVSGVDSLSSKSRCVLILTAVVPKQLPIQTAMAVNTAPRWFTASMHMNPRRSWLCLVPVCFAPSLTEFPWPERQGHAWKFETKAAFSSRTACSTRPVPLPRTHWCQ